MRFLKEFVIIILIFIFVFYINTLTEKITKNAVSEINKQISDIESDIKNNENNINEKLKKVRDSWNEKDHTLSFFVVHSELENVSVNIELAQTDIENNLKEEALEKITEIKFFLNNIEKKYKFKLNNIF